MGKKGIVKGLVLTRVLVYCFLRDQELTVFELLDADQMLNSHFGHRPHMLSNTLRRYYKQGLLYRNLDSGRGHSYRYNLTTKGFFRLQWMASNSERYLYRGKDFVKPLILQLFEQIADYRKRKGIKRIVEERIERARAGYTVKRVLSE